MGADAGCNESNIMIYLGIVEQRANELLSLYINLQMNGNTSAAQLDSSGGGASAAVLGIGPNTPAGMSQVSITVPTTADDLESDDSEEDDEHPLTRDELHAKTMRGLAKREASTARKSKGGLKRR
jgi:hypothetical protein